MSQENVEILRGGFDYFRATGDFPEHLVTADFVWDMSHFRGWPERQAYVGVEGLRDFFRDWGGAWEGWTIEADEFHDVGDTRLRRCAALRTIPSSECCVIGEEGSQCPG
jgi:hypothetical protein